MTDTTTAPARTDARPAKAPENLAAVGIGVADLARAEDFYVRVLGMSVQQRIAVTGSTPAAMARRSM